MTHMVNLATAIVERCIWGENQGHLCSFLDLHQAAQFEAWHRRESWNTVGLLVRHDILTEISEERNGAVHSAFSYSWARMADFADFAIMDGDADNDQ